MQAEEALFELFWVSHSPLAFVKVTFQRLKEVREGTGATFLQPLQELSRLEQCIAFHFVCGARERKPQHDVCSFLDHLYMLFHKHAFERKVAVFPKDISALLCLPDLFSPAADRPRTERSVERGGGFVLWAHTGISPVAQTERRRRTLLDVGLSAGAPKTASRQLRDGSRKRLSNLTVKLSSVPVETTAQSVSRVTQTCREGP